MSRNETQDEFRTVLPQSSTVLTEGLRTRILGRLPAGQDFREVREFQCDRCGERVATPFTPHCCATLPVATTNPKDLVGETKATDPQNVLRTLPASPEERKQRPLATGCLDYFPLALAEVARCSKAGNDQHNAGQPLHWARTKSLDHADCLVRHLLQRGTVDSDGIRHAAKVAWRALALLQTELEQAAGWKPEQGL